MLGALAGGVWTFGDGNLMTASQLNWMILTAGNCSSRLDRERAGWPCKPCGTLIGCCWRYGESIRGCWDGIGELSSNAVQLFPTAWVLPFLLSRNWPLWSSYVNTCQSQTVNTPLQFKLHRDHAILCAPIKMLMPKVYILRSGKATLSIIWMTFSEGRINFHLISRQA